jgi:hypothetical protein
MPVPGFVRVVGDLAMRAVGVLLVLYGLAVLWESESLMTWLIHEVGEERALGPQNVIRLKNGGTLLTNPAAMVKWTMPFWLMGVTMIAGGLKLALSGVTSLFSGNRNIPPLTRRSGAGEVQPGNQPSLPNAGG